MNLIKLVEERGVGIHKFRNEIDEIAQYVQNRITQLKPIKSGNIEKDGVKITFKEFQPIPIPESITTKFDWIDYLVIDVNVKMLFGYDNQFKLHGTGWINNNEYQKIENDKLNGGKMSVDCFAVDGQLIPRTLYLVLYHEFNHMWENYQRLQNGVKNGLHDTLLKFNYQNIIKHATSNKDKDIKDFCYVIYRLLCPTEVNALVASVYGDLQALNSTSYKEDYKQTQAYQEYIELKQTYIPYFEKLDVKTFYKLHQYYPIKSNSVKQYKDNFISLCNLKLTDLFHKTNKAASLYYEDTLGNTNESRNIQEQNLLITSFDQKYDDFNRTLKQMESEQNNKLLKGSRIY